MPRPGKAALAALAAGAALVALALPAFGQDAPESLLPPGFGEPVPAAPAAPAVSATPAAPGADVPALALAPPEEGDLLGNVADPVEEIDPEQAAAEEREREMPSYARRPIDAVGPLGEGNGGLGPDGFGTENGRFLAGLMARMAAPIASRWGDILLRRALLTRVPTPRGIATPDWIAERALLLLRMGEADAARLLVQAVDVQDYSPRLYQVAMQVALATADPAALCPIADGGAALSKEPAWPLARAVCAGLQGESGTANALIDRERGRRSARRIDLLLAERIAAAGANSRRAVNIEWSGVDRLTAWRFGMANAAGLAVPETLYLTAGPQVRAWAARAPMIPAADRIGAARLAATLGVFSSAALVDLYSAVHDADDPYAMAETPGGQLRRAYVGANEGERLAALRALWTGSEDPRERYAAAILTARAAARIAPSDERADDAALLIGAMLSAGLDRQAARWAGVVTAMDDKDGAEAWAMLALGAPGRVVAADPDRIAAFAERTGDDEGRLRGAFLLAGLAGLGRLSQADAAAAAEQIGVRLTARNAWTRALDKAVAAGEPATVALLVGSGLQSSRWQDVSPAFLYHMVAALRAVGHEPEARMIAVEAVQRLAA